MSDLGKLFGMIVFIVFCVIAIGALDNANRKQNGIIIIDGCEYIKHDSYQNHTMTHKGNCKNH
tara:strand:+ start:62 stop:250 length:189 start_codon:yes stop_codon:yes gene_type:complete